MVAQPTTGREHATARAYEYNVRRTRRRKTGRQGKEKDAKEARPRRKDDRQGQEGDGEEEGGKKESRRQGKRDRDGQEEDRRT